MAYSFVNNFECCETKIEESDSQSVWAKLPGVWLRHSVHVNQCEDWQLYGFRGSVADHWRLKPEMSWVRFSTTAGLFIFLYFLLITSEFMNFQHEARCCVHILLLKLLLASGPAKNMSPACKDACVQMMNRFCNWNTYQGHSLVPRLSWNVNIFARRAWYLFYVSMT